MSAPPFGDLSVTFRQLLHNLEHLCHCTVIKVGDAGIPDVDGSASGDLYEVTRSIPGVVLYTHIEVYSYELPVLPTLFEEICAELGIPHACARGIRN